MKLLTSLRNAISRLLHATEFNSEVDAELRAHIRHRADDLERSGISRAEAERRARIEFGGVERFKEESKEAAGGTRVESVFQDLRFGVRVLRKSPGFTLVAIITLALGIGANAVVFSVMNAFILKPLSVPHAESFFGVQHGDEPSSSESYPDYLDLAARNRSFDGLAAYDIETGGFDAGENPVRAWIELASGNYFDALQLQPFLGRFFHASDEHGPDSAPYIVLTYPYWHIHFHDDPGVVGRIVRVNKHPFTIIGVTPPEFHGTIVFFNPDLFVPMVDQAQIMGANLLDHRNKTSVFMSMGHLKPGVTLAQATADLNSIGEYLQKTYPTDTGARTFKLVQPGLYGDYLGRSVRAFLTALMSLALLVLLAACANLGSLFAARSTERSREIAVRLALGASRSRILQQLFSEAFLISIAGGVAGIFCSVVLLRGLSHWQPFSKWPVYATVTPDANVYLVAALLTLASGVLFGAVPVRQVLRTNPYEVVKSGSAVSIGRRITLRDVLLGAQIAICALLMTSSIVAARGLARSLHSNFGFEPRNATLVEASLDEAGYAGDKVAPMQKRLIDGLAAVPGVTAVGLVDVLPLASGEWFDMAIFNEATTDLRPQNSVADAIRYAVSPEYFAAAGTTLLEGRDFSWHDDKNSPRVAIINQEFARKVFGAEGGALGRFFKVRDASRIQVVGIAENGKYTGLTEDPQPAVFLSILQSPSSATMLVVRSGRDPKQLEPALREELRELDPALPTYIRTFFEDLNAPLFGARMATLALGVLGAIGALLSITGIFGIAAYSVSKRKRELGIRMALGASRKEVLSAALGRAVKLLAFGSAAGLVLGILASRVLASIVYSATPRDPLVLAGAVLAMLLVGLLATWIPAQHALSLDPLKLLREE